MYKSKIFYQYREKEIIQNIILKTGNETDSYHTKIEKYVTTKAYQFIKFHNPILEFKSYDIYSLPQLPKIIYVLVLTKTNTNHPYLLYLSLEDIYLTFLIPFGKERKQADSDIYYSALDECDLVEKMAMYILIEKSIMIRKRGILESDQFSLIQCSNITNCSKRYHEIDKMNITNSEKQKFKDIAREFYLHKAIEFLQYYFALLDNKEYDEAYEFLKGDDGKYFNKQRLNTFFKNTKAIIGHLEIFISLYELYFTAREKLFGY